MAPIIAPLIAIGGGLLGSGAATAMGLGTGLATLLGGVGAMAGNALGMGVQGKAPGLMDTLISGAGGGLGGLLGGGNLLGGVLAGKPAAIAPTGMMGDMASKAGTDFASSAPGTLQIPSSTPSLGNFAGQMGSSSAGQAATTGIMGGALPKTGIQMGDMGKLMLAGGVSSAVGPLAQHLMKDDKAPAPTFGYTRDREGTPLDRIQRARRAVSVVDKYRRM